jgi:hypothetical protein
MMVRRCGDGQANKSEKKKHCVPIHCEEKNNPAPTAHSLVSKTKSNSYDRVHPTQPVTAHRQNQHTRAACCRISYLAAESAIWLQNQLSGCRISYLAAESAIWLQNAVWR